MNSETILVVEDDAAMRLGLEKTLRAHGFLVIVAKNGKEGLEKALAHAPDLLLLDVMMPEMNGFEVCEAVRAHDPEVPILFLSAKGEEEDKVRGLRLGADDYVVKPFGREELIARVESALRRIRLRKREVSGLSFGSVVVDFEAHSVKRNGENVPMTALEMKLLAFMALNEGRLLPRQRILNAVWGADYFGTDRTVDNFVTRLRAKLEDDPQSPRFFLTMRGAGYRFTRKPL